MAKLLQRRFKDALTILGTLVNVLRRRRFLKTVLHART
jgi:hypothetical protein